MGPALDPPYPHHLCPGHTGNGSWLSAPGDGRQREGQRLRTDDPHNDGRPPPPERPPTTPAARSPPQGIQATGTVQGPQARTPPPTAIGWRTPTARPEAGQPGEDERLASDAPHNGAGHPPLGTPSRHPHRAPRRLARAHPVGPVLGPPCPHHAWPGHTSNGSWLLTPRVGRQREGQRMTPDAPHKVWKAARPGTATNHPGGTQPPAGHASQRDSDAPPRSHTRAHSVWAADPDSPPRGRAAGGGRAPDLTRPLQRRKAPPQGKPSSLPHSAQRQIARAHAVEPVLGPPCQHQRCPGHTGSGSLPPAPRDGRPGEGQRLTPGAPHNGGRPAGPGDGLLQPPRHAAPRRVCKAREQC